MKIRGFDAISEAFLDQWLDKKVRTITAQTSGSTGRPKSVELLKTDMIHSARLTNEFFDIDKNSVLVDPLSANFIAGKMMIVRALEAKCQLWIETPSLIPVVGDYGPIDLLPIVPAQADSLIQRAPLAKRIRNLLVGGGALPPVMENALLQIGYRGYASYGMTETCSHVALRPLGEDTYTALGDVTFSLGPEDNLIIHSEEFSWGTLETRDVVELFSPTEFRWRGRLDGVINTGGIKIFPEEVESSLSELLADYPFYITSTPDRRWGQAVTLVIEGDHDVNELMMACRSVLHPYATPKRIFTNAEIHYTPSGKVIRESIQDFDDGYDTPYDQPQDYDEGPAEGYQEDGYGQEYDAGYDPQGYDPDGGFGHPQEY